MSTTNQDPLAYVVGQLKGMKAPEIARLAIECGMTERTVRNVRNGKGVHYETVRKLHENLQAAAKAKPKKRTKVTA